MTMFPGGHGIMKHQKIFFSVLWGIGPAVVCFFPHSVMHAPGNPIILPFLSSLEIE